MKPNDLIKRHADAWYTATHHPFLDAVRDGTLAPAVFATWLVQDYLFVRDELASQARLLARAPRNGQNILVKSLSALEAELGWFEEHARQHKLSLNVAHYPTTVAYSGFFARLEQEPYPVAITAIWAVERAYLESWQHASPGHPRYREYVEHWANAEFAQFVSELEQVVTAALATSRMDSAAEVAFLNVVRLEGAFWQMAWSGGAR